MKLCRPVASALRGVFVSALLVVAAAAQQRAAPLHSTLWGAQGEKWAADGRLPDFSRAG